MSDTTRRNFLAVAGVSAAGLAAVSVVGAGSAAAAPAASQSKTNTALPKNATGSMVAYVRDVRDGRVSVMVGDREVVIRDRELVARLANAVAN